MTEKVLTHSDLRRCASCSRRNYDKDYLNRDGKMTGYCPLCRAKNRVYENRTIEFKNNPTIKKSPKEKV